MISACFARLDDVRLVEREAIPVRGRHVDGAHALAEPAGVHHLDRLAAEILAQHRALAGAQGRLVDVELVRVHRALHHGLAEAVGGGDEHHVAKSGIGVEREHHAGGCQVAAHHVLDADR
jgi:hypothetical protein